MAGEISPDITFSKKAKKHVGALRMGAYGLAWERVDALIRRETKTRQKEEQMGEQDIFSDA